MDAQSDAIPAPVSQLSDREIEATFREHYGTIARVIARVVGDPARAEELAVDAFLRWWQRTGARGEGAGKWLYRVAVRMGIDELRRNARRERYARFMAPLSGRPATPEDVQAVSDERRRVRAVLATLSRRDAALLILRSEGLPYQDLAAALRLNPASVGTLISRAQRAFRTEYMRRYDTPSER